VEELVSTLPAELTADQRTRAADLIKSYAQVFSKSATDLGRNSFVLLSRNIILAFAYICLMAHCVCVRYTE
jgi:hypothetical protein